MNTLALLTMLVYVCKRIRGPADKLHRSDPAAIFQMLSNECVCVMCIQFKILSWSCHFIPDLNINNFHKKTLGVRSIDHKYITHVEHNCWSKHTVLFIKNLRNGCVFVDVKITIKMEREVIMRRKKENQKSETVLCADDNNSPLQNTNTYRRPGNEEIL